MMVEAGSGSGSGFFLSLGVTFDYSNNEME